MRNCTLSKLNFLILAVNVYFLGIFVQVCVAPGTFASSLEWTLKELQLLALLHWLHVSWRLTLYSSLLVAFFLHDFYGSCRGTGNIFAPSFIHSNNFLAFDVHSGVSFVTFCQEKHLQTCN